MVQTGRCLAATVVSPASKLHAAMPVTTMGVAVLLAGKGGLLLLLKVPCAPEGATGAAARAGPTTREQRECVQRMAERGRRPSLRRFSGAASALGVVVFDEAPAPRAAGKTHALRQDGHDGGDGAATLFR